MQLACCVQDQPCANRWWFWWQCPVLVLRSCTSWNQGLRSTVTITGIQFCWICFCRISALFLRITTFFQQDGAPAHRARDTITMLQPAERDARVYPSRFESGGLQQMGYASREGLPLADPWCEWVERTSAERVEAANPHRHAITQWRSRLYACVRVNGGHFEHKFWASDFLLRFVCFINTGFCKCVIDINMCKVLILVWNVLLLCLRLSHGMVAI